MTPIDEVLVPWRSEAARLFLEVRAFLRRFVVLDGAQLTAVALWVLHTHVYSALGITPYLSITSAEKQSGKSVLLEVLAELVREPWLTGSVSPAVLARKVDAVQPTLLLDETDAAFRGDREWAEALRGVLNTGFKRSGNYSRCEGNGANLTFRDYRTFCPKAIAGIGQLPDTIADRSIPIRLKRMAPGERVECKRERTIADQAAPLREALSVWAAEQEPRLQALECTPFEEVLEALPPRAADIWEPLLGIARLASQEVLEQAKKAALTLSAPGEEYEASLGERLLSDIRNVFHQQEAERLSSSELVGALLQIEESPWAELRAGRALSPTGLASLLRPYGIRPRTVRLGDGRTPKGYHAGQFEDAFARYLPPPSVCAATPPQPALQAALSHGGFVSGSAPVAAGDGSVLASGDGCGAVAAALVGGGQRRATGAGRRARRSPSDEQLARLLAFHRPQLVRREDITTVAERREIARLLFIEEQLKNGLSSRGLDGREQH